MKWRRHGLNDNLTDWTRNNDGVRTYLHAHMINIYRTEHQTPRTLSRDQEKLKEYVAKLDAEHGG